MSLAVNAMWATRTPLRTFTTITPLPAFATREMAVKALHNHAAMIELDPCMVKFDPMTPSFTGPNEEFPWTWYQMTNKLPPHPTKPSYDRYSTYNMSFNNLPQGLQTHVFTAPGVDIKSEWTIGGNMPGEPQNSANSSPMGAPRNGLYLRQDVQVYADYPRKNMYGRTASARDHSILIQRLAVNANSPPRRSGAVPGLPAIIPLF